MELGQFGGSSSSSPVMWETPNEDRWIFSRNHMLHRTPSRKEGIPADKELIYRQNAATFIQIMGRQMRLRQLVMHTATVYLHRFYMHHAFTILHWKPVSLASLFLACKAEDNNRTAHQLVKAAFFSLYGVMTASPTPEDDARFKKLAEDMIMCENVLLPTLGFEFKVDHPHGHIVSLPMLLNDTAGVLTKDFIKACYTLATNSLCYTTFSVELSASVVACVCIHACAKEWQLEIPKKDDREWFEHVAKSKSVTYELLEKYANELATTYEKVPEHLKKQLSFLETHSLNGATSPCSPMYNYSGKGASGGSSGELATNGVNNKPMDEPMICGGTT